MRNKVSKHKTQTSGDIPLMVASIFKSFPLFLGIITQEDPASVVSQVIKLYCNDTVLQKHALLYLENAKYTTFNHDNKDIEMSEDCLSM
jgi:hypothetical protein